MSHNFLSFFICFTYLCINCDIAKTSDTLETKDFFPLSNVKVSSSTNIKKLYQLMKDTHELFEKNNITYWLEGGTLLGCIRHKGIIPWDDDLDIAIDREDVSKLKKIEFQLEELGYELVLGEWLIIQSKTGFIIDNRRTYGNKDIRVPWLDIFLFEKKDLNYIHASAYALNRWPQDEFTVESIENKKLACFGSFKVWIPCNAEKYLINLYGKDVLTHGLWQGHHEVNHDNNKIRENFKWLLQETDKFPAVLEGTLEDRIK